MAKKSNNPIPSFNLRAIELHDLSIMKPIVPGPPVVNFNFEINIETSIDANQKVIIIITKVQINVGEKLTRVGSIACACIFNVLNFEEVVRVNEDQTFVIEDSFSDTLNSISISTTRGVLFSELRGTNLHFAFLPIIDIKSLSKAVPISRG